MTQKFAGEKPVECGCQKGVVLSNCEGDSEDDKYHQRSNESAIAPWPYDSSKSEGYDERNI